MFVSGPFSYVVQSEQFQQPCKDYWWTNLLYINNFYPTGMAEEVIMLLPYIVKYTLLRISFCFYFYPTDLSEQVFE